MADEYKEIEGWEVDFDEGEEEGGDFTLLAPGYYPFEVKAVKKGFTNGNPPSKCVDFTIKVGTGPESTTVNERIAMHSGTKWKMAQLSRSLGLRKHGEKFTFKPLETVGLTGWCEVDNREFTFTRGEKEGKTGYANDITKFLDPEDAPADGKPQLKAAKPEGDAEDEW